MNNEEYINKAIEPLLKMYTKIENDLLVMIAEHFKANAEFLNSDYWRIQKLEEMGLFNEEVIEYLAQYTNSTKEEILKALEEIGYDIFNINKLESAFENGKLKINPSTLIENNTIQNIINNAYNELSNHFIELSNKIENSAREAYLNVVEQGYLKTSMGTHSYQGTIRESLNNLGNKGITTLTYTTTDDEGNVTGIRNYDVEGTVRRDILTGVRSLSNNINKTVVEELECEWVYLSEHLRCRPTHFDWQGTIIKYEDLESVTRYGEADGLAGINCAHYFEPYFGDARGDELKSIPKEDALEQYNLSQQQRYLERGIRKWKRKVEIFKANGDTDAQGKSQNKVKEWQNRLKDFAKENNLRRDYTREYVTIGNKSKNKLQEDLVAKNIIGKFDINKYTNSIKTSTKDVVLFEERIKHIIERHPEVEKYIKDIPNIIENPDLILQETKRDSTIWIIKKIDKNVKITMKLNTTNDKKLKNSIIQMQFMRDSEIDRNIRNGKVIKIFDKNDKK